MRSGVAAASRVNSGAKPSSVAGSPGADTSSDAGGIAAQPLPCASARALRRAARSAKNTPHSRLRLARGKGLRLVDTAVREGLVEGRLRDLAKTRLGQAHGHGRLGGHHLGHLARPAHQLLRPVDQIVDQADRATLRGVHHAPGERELDGTGETDAGQHQHGAGDARDAGVDLGLAHAHAGVADAHVRQHRGLESRARGNAVERRQTGLIEIADGIVEAAPGFEPVGTVVAGLKFLGLVEILARGEGTVAGSGHDHGAHARVFVPAAQHARRSLRAWGCPRR